MEDTRLGSILLETGLVSEKDLQHCLEVQALTGGRWPLGQILVEQGVVTQSQLESLLAVQAALRASRELEVGNEMVADGGFLEAAIALGANDLFLSEGRRPFARAGGELVPLSAEPLAGPEIWTFVREQMGMGVLERIAERQSVTMPMHDGVPARGRITAFRHFDGIGVAMRLHREKVRGPEEADLDPRVVESVRTGRGLVLLAGERGAGVTETFATLLQVAVAGGSGRSVLVLDRSFEYGVPDGGAIVTRRCVGRDTKDWASGIRAALREEPDVLFVAEIDSASFDLAVQAAEAGALVVAGVRAPTAMHALARVIGFHAAHDVARVRSALASALLAVLAVRTVPRADRRGLALATELLLLDGALRDLVRTGSLARVRALLRIDGNGHGLDTSLLRLAASGIVRFEDAFLLAQDKAQFLDARRAPQEAHA